MAVLYIDFLVVVMAVLIGQGQELQRGKARRFPLFHVVPCVLASLRESACRQAPTHLFGGGFLRPGLLLFHCLWTSCALEQEKQLVGYTEEERRDGGILEFSTMFGRVGEIVFTEHYSGPMDVAALRKTLSERLVLPQKTSTEDGDTRLMSVKQDAVVTSPRRFALHHLTSLALIILGLSLCAFVGIADEVLEGDTLRFDRLLLLALRALGDPGDPLGPAWVEEMFRDFTALGGIGVLGLLTVASVGYLWLTGLRRVAVFLSLAIAGGLLLSLALKTGFHRPRPDLVSHGAMIYTSSFPSGHSMLSAVVYLTGGALLAVVHPARRVRVYLIGCSILATLLVGVSRVYLGVHWPSDVLAGWAAGAAWAAGCWLMAQWFQERGRIERGTT